MNNRLQLTSWGVVAALGLAAATSQVLAAQTVVGSTDSETSKSLAQVERANKLIGKTVIGSDNQKLGKIDNFVVDLQSGHILYAIIGSGGVLGAGEKQFVITPELFTGTTAGEDAHVSIDKSKLKGAPEFKKEMDKDLELGKADFVGNIYTYYGQNAWWQDSKAVTDGNFSNVHKVSDLIGMKIKNSTDETLGKIENVSLDVTRGRVLFVVFSPETKLNLGDNYYALPPDSLKQGSDRKMLVSDITKEKLVDAPHFTKDDWKQLSDQAFASKVYQYYGKQAYFQTGTTLRPTGRENIKNH